MDMNLISQNLRRIRMAKRLSKTKAAELSGISRISYGKIEGGESIPKVTTLQNIVAALGVPLHELFAPVTTLKAVRFRAHKKMNSREQILTDVARRLEDYNFLEELLQDTTEYLFQDIVPKLSSEAPGEKRAEFAAITARRVLGLSEKEPIRDIAGLLESSGIKLFPLTLTSDSFLGLSVAASEGGPAIVVNVWERISVERWIFSAAHELGHLLLHLDAYQVDEMVENEAQEIEANMFASYFLMPQRSFSEEWKETYGLSFLDRVLKIKRIFQVSYSSVLYRLAQTTDLGKDVWSLFQREYQKRTGKTFARMDEPDALLPNSFHESYPEVLRAQEPDSLSPSAFVEDRLSKLVRMAVERNEISMGRGAEILRLDMEAMRDRAASWVE